MNAEIKQRLGNLIASGLALNAQPEEIAVVVVESLRLVDGDMAFANAPTYSSCLSNDDIWKRFIDEILA